VLKQYTGSSFILKKSDLDQFLPDPDPQHCKMYSRNADQQPLFLFRLPKAYDVKAREREERKRKREEGRGDDLDAFPVMMSFKAFLETQDDYITDEEALHKESRKQGPEPATLASFLTLWRYF
jgi:hypothetical protein